MRWLLQLTGYIMIDALYLTETVIGNIYCNSALQTKLVIAISLYLGMLQQNKIYAATTKQF